jgi:ComF family protein
MQSLLPQACLLCGSRVRGNLICPACIADLPIADTACPQCAVPTHHGEICGHCLKHAPAFERTLAAFIYAFPLDALVKKCKYGQAVELTGLFAEHMAQRIGAAAPIDLLVPMPLHPARLAERGFNQAVEIARRLSPRLGIPWQADTCHRIRNTPPQAGLELKARQRNLRGAFVCNARLSGKRIALIDDVMTSGSSLNELARAVRQAGAAEVHAWVLARTP